MADKIANFSDYKKRESEKNEEVKKDLSETTEINNIEIVDPYNFFNAEEREEYFKERQKESLEETKKEHHKEDARREEPRREEPRREERREDPEDEYDEEDYEEEYDEEEGEDEERGGITPELLVRIASIITGVFILAMIAFTVKVKVIDKYLNDPDEQQTEVTALPSGFVEKNDTVTVTGASSLNLRSGPSTDSAKVGTVDEGTQLKRIAVAEDGSWALVEYEGQQVYASMKYLKE
ncbi:SH3 domain-containing protein [Butyrivibrio hungatei]|uniref:Bacterial SH3 domain-containing protein n=1 Tax=Butyrivibrio hungatei TaxID=185008 RepID=A0A1D9P5B2_9FIRM|nr:SH3 domain-containing protein [Butyrivibrio hungatei]AOZ97749.1 bacterial SH3 domain-containing protein [Butyrivibrio hungatei]